MVNQDIQKDQTDLDELDLMLVRAFEEDARVSYKALASKLGTSHPTVRRRVSRLIRRGMIRITTIPTYAMLGYKTIVALAINAPPGAVSSIAEQLSLADSIKFVWITSGSYDILAIAMYPSPDEYMERFPEEMRGVSRDVKIESMLTLKVIGKHQDHITEIHLVSNENENVRFIPTDLELAVIKELKKAPRATGEELAQKIAVNPSVVRSCLRKLLSHGIVRIVSVPNPEAFGYSVNGAVLIQVHPSELNHLIDQLKGNPFVKRLGHTIGTFNCVIWTSFQNSDQMYDFLSKDLGNIPGVVHYESLVTIKVQKEVFGM